MEPTYMSIDRGMDKEDVTHIYNVILLSHIKEWNNAICSNRDGLRDYHTEWSKSHREQVSNDIACIWNLKKWYKWTYLQNRHRVKVVQNKLMVTKGERSWRDKLGDSDWHIHSTTYKLDNNKTLLYSPGNSTQYPVMTYVGIVSKKELIYVYIWLIHFAVQQKLTQHCKTTII